MKKRTVLTAAFVFLILALIAGFFDMGLSRLAYHPQYSWVRFMDKYGQLPAIFLCFIGSGLLLRLGTSGNKLKRSGWFVLFFILSFASSLSICTEIHVKKHLRINDVLLNLVISLVLVIAMQFCFSRLPLAVLNKYRRVATLSVLMVSLSGTLTVWLIKVLWGRWTYWGILKSGEQLYTSWYHINGPNGHHSFISGHTSMAFCLLPLILLFSKKTATVKAVWAAILTWGIIMASSRVIIGAHYASDVLFAAFQSLLWFYLLINIHDLHKAKLK